MQYRTTIEKEVCCAGIGVFSGKPIKLVFKPASIGSGIRFVGADSIQAHWRHLCLQKFSTTVLVGAKSRKVAMTEHLLAACYGLGITDLTVEMDSEENPIFDGSSLLYVNALLSGGLKSSKQETSWIVLDQPLSVTKGQGTICLRPGPPVIQATVSFHAQLSQTFCFHYLFDHFIRDIAPARTFLNLEDMGSFQKSTRFLGGSLSSALLLHQGRPINQGGFRLDQECARHKILDIMGDFALLGHFFYGAITAHMPSHRLNHEAIFQLIQHPENFRILSFRQLFQSACEKKYVSMAIPALRFSGHSL